MNTSRRAFLQTTAATAAAGKLAWPSFALPSGENLEAFEIATRHRIEREGPTPNFFEGMLLGNGDIGVTVTVRPDALGLHIGKEDSWDIRVSEDHAPHVLTFAKLKELWEAASIAAKGQFDPNMLHLESNINFFRDYTEKVSSSYRKPWPRPWPCGIVWLDWDLRLARVARQSLDISNGLFTLEFRHEFPSKSSEKVSVFCLVNREAGHLAVWSDAPAPFVSLVYYPSLDPEAYMPSPEIDAQAGPASADFSCHQHFPATPPARGMLNPPRTDKDRNFALSARLRGSWMVEGLEESRELLKSLEAHVARTEFHEPPGIHLKSLKEQRLRLDLALATPRDHAENVAFAHSEVARLSEFSADQLQRQSEESWKTFWSRSAISIEDEELERLWYHNQYFLACCLREGKVAPGLFANWTSGRIGTAWHGDYHLNYNTQQVFWGVFSSNHPEQHIPYVELVEHLLPMSETYAKEKFGLPGAFFPHSAYPVPSQTFAYPAPPWGYEISETPWAVQSLWWHYLYTQDKDLLKRAYPILRAAVEFLAAYAEKGADGKYHIIPTVSPENWGFTVDYRLNKDCIMDLALTDFVLNAVVEASLILDTDGGERDKWTEIRDNLAKYPEGKGPFGTVWLDVEDAPVEHVYNIPVTLAPVFPGERVGIGVGETLLETARRTAQGIRLEGGNDLVYFPLILARLGELDFDWFKRQVRYCLLANGVANDRVRQAGGRYTDATDFDFMMRMGIWTENLSLPAVLNECLLQSYTGVIRLFPNSRGLAKTSFRNLRAVGAFLVNASYDGNKVTEVSMTSEKGMPVRLANPWGKIAVKVTRVKDNQAIPTEKEKEIIRFETEPGERYRIEAGA